MDHLELINQLYKYGKNEKQVLPTKEALAFLIRKLCAEFQSGKESPGVSYLQKLAQETAVSCFGTGIYMRGLIEFTNYCRNNCYYCGIRRGNEKLKRYRLTPEEILSCCDKGRKLGFQTFVLQGGEDMQYSDAEIADLIGKIKDRYPDSAVTLSFGERSYSVYKQWFDAGADRYLLRHETASKTHYEKLHPPDMSYENRIDCLFNLKEIGYQTGSGFMVGSPYQTEYDLAEDLIFLSTLKPHMIGIGPFLPHKDTPFRNEASGTLEQTLIMLGLLRIIFPSVLLPATTALASLTENGREQGILFGANVVMPNLSPVSVREHYMLYDGKAFIKDEAAEGKAALEMRLEKIGYHLAEGRGDYREVLPGKEKN